MQGADAPTRDEKIVVGIDATGNVTGEMWNGSSWSALPLNNMGTVSETYWYGAEVAYEQLSGDAIVVWNDNSQAAGDKLRYAVWDGTSWSTPQSIGVYSGAEPQNHAARVRSGLRHHGADRRVTSMPMIMHWSGTATAGVTPLPWIPPAPRSQISRRLRCLSRRRAATRWSPMA